MLQRLTALSFLLFTCTAGPSVAMPCADVALVLAIDSSSSIDDAELALQMRGTALALMDPEVVAAMQAVGGVAVAAVLWGDSAWGAHVTDWQLISSAKEAKLFAAGLVDQPRLTGGNTDLGHGLNIALDLLDQPDNCATRRVIDVSGDGRETLYSRPRSISLLEARERAQGSGIIINGLAITTDDPVLADYYASSVILGQEAFVVSVAGYGSFADAMKYKLLKEVWRPLTPMLTSFAQE